MAISLTTSPGAISLSRNPIYVGLTSTSFSSLENYRVVLRVEVETTYLSGTYTQVCELETVPTSAGLSSFDLRGILHAELELHTTFQVPTLDDQQAYASDTIRRYRLKYFERYGTPQVDQSITTSSAYSVLMGGVDAHYFGLFDFFSNVTEENSFITQMPDGHVIARDQAEYLSWINHTGSDQNPYISVSMWDVDGAVITPGILFYNEFDAGFDPPFLKPWQIGVFPISPSLIGIDSSCVKFRVSVHVGEFGVDSAVSGYRDYYIDDAYQEVPSTIIWFDSFRLPSILRCVGRKKTRLQVSRQVSEHVVGFGYDPTTVASVQTRRDFNHLFEYRTGAVHPDVLDALQELLIENMLLEYSIDRNYYRLALTQNQYDIYEQRRSPNYLEFSATRALAPGNYMRLRMLSGVSTENNIWQQNDNGFWVLNTGSGYYELNS